MQKRVLIAGLIGLVLGVALGFWVGRAALEAKWSEPLSTLTPEEASRLTVPDSDPVPKPGTKLLGRMPLNRARLALKPVLVNDPVIVTVGSVANGSDESDISLHLRVENRGDCEVKRFAGVAYGFRSTGAPTRLNKSKEHFVAFAFEQTIEPKGTEQVETHIKHAPNASIVLAQVDQVECMNGKKWARN